MDNDYQLNKHYSNYASVLVRCVADMCYKDRPDMEKNLLDWEQVNAVDYMEKVNKDKRDTVDSRAAVAVEDR